MATVAEYNAMSSAERAAIIQQYVTETLAAGGTAADIAAAMDTYNVPVAEVAAAMNVDESIVQANYDAAAPTGLFAGEGKRADESGMPTTNIGGKALGPADNTNAGTTTVDNTTSRGNLGTTGLTQAAQDMSTSTLAKIPTPKGASDTVVRSYIEMVSADTTLSQTQKEQLVADRMVEYGVTPVQVARVTGSDVKDIITKFKEYQPDVDPMAAVNEALTSPTLTQEQYNVLSAYFGNENLPQDQNQIGDFVGRKTGFEFANYAATRDASQGGGDRVKQQELLQSAYVPFIGGKPTAGMMSVQDGDGFKMVPSITDPITGRQTELKLIDPDNNLYAVDYGALGRAPSDPEETGYIPSMIYQWDPEKNEATFLGGVNELEKVSGGFFESARGLLPIATAALGGYLFAPSSASSVAFSNLAEQVGFQMFGLTGTAAQMATAALVSGTSTGLLTGDPKAAALAAALAAGGLYAKDAGLFKSAMESIGLGDQWESIKAQLDSSGGKISYSDALSQFENAFDIGDNIDNVISGGTSSLNPASNITSYAKDTWDITKDVARVQSELEMIGVDSLTAADIANQVSTGKSVADIVTDLTNFYGTNLSDLGNVTKLNDFTNTNGDINTLTNTDQIARDVADFADNTDAESPLGKGGTLTTTTTDTGGTDTGGTNTTTTSGSDVITTTAGGTIGAGAVTTGLDWLKNLLGGGTSGGLFGNQSANQLAALLASGALTQGTIDQLRSLGSNQRQQFSDLATQATKDIQFTPYGVTTSLFGTQPTEGGMAGTLTPQGQQLSDAALQAALSSYGQAGTMDLNQMAADRMAQYQQLVGPEQARARLAAEARLAAQGRLGIGAAGGEYAPELKALEDAIAKQNLQFAIQAPQEALNQRTALLQQGASAAAVPTSLAGQQLQAIQQGGTLGQQAANTAYQQGGLFAQTAGLGLANQLQANIAAGTISAERAKALGQALTGAFAPTSQQTGSSGGGMLSDLLNLIGGGGSTGSYQQYLEGYGGAE